MRRLIVFLLGAILLVGCGSTASSATTKQSTPGTVGSAIRSGDFTITVNHVTTPTVDPDDFDQPKDGYHYVVVDVSIQNASGQELDPTEDIEWDVKDSSGRSFRDDWSAPTTQPSLHTIQAGDVGRGEIGFQVADDAADLRLVATIYEHWDVSGFNILDPTSIASAMAKGRPKELGVVQFNLQ